jgi:2-polyprenyl-6-methoxyphenol hydroxylase-like FAD-dependent oxidoreductase
VLLEHLRAHGGRVRFRTELTGFRTDGTGVYAELHDRPSGRAESARARYLIGADGPRSSVRAGLGVDV